LGVDAIIIGSITQFQREDKNINLGLRKETKATVAIDARIVQIGTGEILGVAQGKGESKRARMKTEDDNHPAFRSGQDMWSAEYAVLRPGREIKDPATGNVLRRTTAPVGKIKITSADEGSATGTLTGDLAHVGDCVGVCPLGLASAAPR